MTEMFYALVHFPEIDIININRLRKKYDPTYKNFDPHITIMFPVPDSEGEDRLLAHIKSILKNWEVFPIQLGGFVKSWDHWLFLTLQEGKLEVIQLYNEIYSGILSNFRRTDIEFIPHIGLGLFIKENENYNFKDPQKLEFDEQLYNRGLSEAEALGLNYRCYFDKVNFLKLTNDLSKIVMNEEIKLESVST